MKKSLVFLLFYLSVLLIQAIEPHFMEDPAISPDGKTVCFVYLSDLWTVPFAGGDAHRLTSTEGNDWNPVYSPDGTYIAFNSSRDGWKCIYQVPAQGGLATLISSEPQIILDWFPDGKSILTVGSEPNFDRIFYRIFLNGKIEEINKFGGYYASVDKTGDSIIYSRNGLPYREKYTGSSNGDLWLYNIKKDSYKRLTTTDFTERYPVFSYKSNKIYYAASDGNVFQLNSVQNQDFAKPKKISKFKQWSVRDISIARKNENLIFENFSEIRKYNAKTHKISKLDIDIKEDLLDNFEITQEFSNKVKKYTVSPNGKLIVFSYKFDLFAFPTEGGEVKQITFSQKGIENIVIMDDNHTVFFTGYVNGNLNIYRFSILDMTNITKMDWSEDKNVNELYKSENHLLINYDTKQKKGNLAVSDSLGQNIEDITESEYVYARASISPDEKYLLYTETRMGLWSAHIYLYNFQTKEKSLIKNFYGWMYQSLWGKDNKSAFIGGIYRIDLTAKKDFYLEKDHWKDILHPNSETKKSKKNELIIDLPKISDRFYKIIDRDDFNYVLAVKNDSVLYYINDFNDDKTLYEVNYFGKKEKMIHKFSEDADHFSYNAKTEQVFYTKNNRLRKFSLKSKKDTLVKNRFRYKYNKLRLNRDIFDQVWAKFGNSFYDRKMHGTDWNKLHKLYFEYVQYAYSPQILSSIISEMIGDINASHTGFYPRKEKHTKSYSKAYLGIITDLNNSPKEGLKIEKVYRNSKLEKPFGIQSGDLIMEINEHKIGKNKSITKYLIDQVGEKIKLKIQTKDSLKTVIIKGLSSGENNKLAYNNWVSERNKLVAKLSNGEIGYCHIREMDDSSYNKFRQDIFADNYDKKALIIDVRNNGGGNIHDRLIEILTKKSYAIGNSRYFDAQKVKTPANSWEKPIVVLINENSFSDAEIFPHLIKYLKLGKIIGMPTSGSVIGTGHHTFMDGSGMRVPSQGWFTKDDINMEGNGVKPDIEVSPTPKQVATDDDVQLKRAVQELQKMINR